MRRQPPDGTLDAGVAARYGLVAGVDEVGRGALAGPLVVGAVVLDRTSVPEGLDDSKRLAPRTRERLARRIRATAVTWAIAERSAAEVDELGIVEATRRAMREAIEGLRPQPDFVVCDALAPSGLAMPASAEIRADQRYQCVAAASIIAKVARDEMMTRLSLEFPGYGWEQNKGYGTANHLDAVERFGPSTLHRRSFAPLRMLRFESGRATGRWRR